MFKPAKNDWLAKLVILLWKIALVAIVIGGLVLLAIELGVLPDFMIVFTP